MSLHDLPTSLGLLFTLPMKTERSRNKERLEASLAGLCELELLKQRQECRVLGALCLRDPPAPGRQAGGARRSDSCAQDAASSHAPDGCGPTLQTVSYFQSLFDAEGFGIMDLNACVVDPSCPGWFSHQL